MSNTQTDQNGTQTTPNTQDSSVFYIHPSDSSTSQLVSVKFNGTGFHNWKRSMTLTLSAKNKIGFVNGTIDIPPITAPEYKLWERCNDLVISWILFNLDEVIAKSVLFLKTAREIWIDLEERYDYTSIPQVYSLEQQLLDLNQGSDSISEFFTKIKTVWDSINDANPLPYCTCHKCTCNLTLRIQQRQQEQRLLQFMMKLSEQFATVRGNVLMMHPMPSISQVYRLFAQEERHKEVSQVTTQTDAMAFYSEKRRFGSSSQSRNFGNNNFQKRNVPNVTNAHNVVSNTGNQNVANKGYSRPTYFCNHCKIPGHNM